MGLKLTVDEITNRILDQHGDKYSYKYFNVIKSQDFLSIQCNQCGLKFKQKVYAHIRGVGCISCGRLIGAKKKTMNGVDVFKSFMDKNKHKYDYSESIYKGLSKKIKIKCRKHGPFYQTLGNHMNGQGCPSCADCKNIDQDEFVKRSRLVHGDFYDYSVGHYKNAHTKIKIKCPIHGIFEIKPNSHTSGKQGCKQCSLEKKSKLNTIDFSVFLERSRKHHGDFYKYIESTYSGSDGYISIICPHHGEFKQKAIIHSKGHGCLHCGRNLNGFARSNFKRLCNKNNNGIGYLYLVKCWNDVESFYKVGITSQKNHKVRFHGKAMPYQYEFISVINGDAGDIYNLETKLHRMLKSEKYNPRLRFKGDGECFYRIPSSIEKLIKDIECGITSILSI